jgi:predicted AlkP superfamily pyrophosphatase or phosphodiesterase
LSILRRAISLALILTINLCLTVPALAQSSGGTRPRLILLLVVDQFSSQYLARYNELLSGKGMRMLEDKGAYFTNCKYKSATTVTAVGHTVISTGSYPWSNGVVGDAWYDRHKGADIAAITDDNVQLVGGNGVGASCRSMLGTTFGDQLKMATNGRSRIWALSLKDRGSLFLAGKMGNGAIWFDQRSGNFVSSSQFGTNLPSWLRSFNDQHLPDQFFGKAWQRLLPESSYGSASRDDDPYKGSFAGDGRQFPHILNGGASAPSEPFYETFQETPFANDLLGDLAISAMNQESLGQRNDTDLLAVSFSANDSVGHIFGPDSQEAEDTFLRLDQTITRLLQHVDGKVGLSNCLVIITGDHGTAAVPEHLKERAMQTMDAGRIDPKSFKTLLNSALSSRLGKGDWISSFVPPNLYLNLSEVDKQKYRQPEVEALTAKLARSIPGVSEVYTAAQFYSNQLPSGPLTELVKHDYYWGRSGELIVVPKPNYIWSGFAYGTNHGTPYAYDRQVPLLMAGPGINPGRYTLDCSPADIAPTICSLLNLPLPPLCEGRALNEMLGTR